MTSPSERPPISLVVDLECGHKAVFAADKAISQGLPAVWFCGTCKKTYRVVAGRKELH